ncbi:T9SS type A sorting domain-containing protein [bacterium]|nr:T9SS type A sorting domain-containing protein [bacterium]MDB4088271.1 T9SS type A sorting domain-containing protein [Flavobacteriales bacterium]
MGTNYATYSHCNRIITRNLESACYLYFCKFSDPAIVGGNSNPDFVDFYDGLYWEINNNRFLDFSCTDADGDSLVYSMETPLDKEFISGGMPFDTALWEIFAHNIFNILGPGTTCSVNTGSGIVNGRTNQLGLYVIAIKCEEFRNGVKIGEVIRDIILTSKNLPFSTALIETNNDIFLSIYPNPNNGDFNIEFSNNAFEKATLTLYDIQGKILLNKKLEKSNNSIVINTNPGIYIAKIKIDNQEVVKRIIIN